MPQVPLNLTPNLQKLNSGVVKVFTGPKSSIDPSKIVPMYSSGVLATENLLTDAVLAGFSQQVTSQLNKAKTLMNQLGVTDITKAPAIRVNQASLKVVPGQLKVPIIVGQPVTPVVPPLIARAVASSAAAPVEATVPAAARVTETTDVVTEAMPVFGTGTPTFSPITWLVNESVIIASSLDLTNTNLIIDPSVSQLTIIVETLTCGPGAQISFDDSSVWHPVPLPKTTAANGNSYNQNNHPSGSDNGPSGGNGTAGQSGSALSVVPPAAPNVSIYALNITGMPALSLQGLKGAPGNPGQNGGTGGNGAKGINGTDVAVLGVGACVKTPGNGGNGGAGGNGGNGSNGGQGGQGGSFLIATTETNWQTLLNQSWQVSNTGGPGGDPGLPGSGGAGGAGGYPGDPSPGGACAKASGGANGAQGAAGRPGADGPAGSGGVITPTIITAAEWEYELTLPWLETINPSTGAPGTAVTAVGLNIDSGDTVLVNGQAVPTTSPSTGQLHFTLPSKLAGGTATISISRTDGLQSNSMNFSVLPLITSSSASGGFTPGDSITLNGAAFLPNASVHFTPSGQAEQVLIPSSIAPDGTSLTFTVPAAATATSQAQGTAAVMVKNPDGSNSNVLQITRVSFVANGFLPDPNGFAFPNFSPGTPDWGTYQDDFGTLEVDASALAMPVLTTAYFGAYEYFLGSACTGLCTGFSTAAMNRFLNGETRTVDEAAAPTAAITRELTVDMGRLLSGQLLSTFLGQCLNGLQQALATLQQIEQTFTNGPTRDNMPLIFFIPAGLPVSSQWFNNLNASHCLVPYKLSRPPGWTSGYDGARLYLYDCNHPRDNSSFLTFQQSGNMLSFTYNKDSSVCSDNGWTLGVLTMDQALYNSVDLPWVFGAELGMEFVVDIILSPATLAVSNLAGQTTGIRGDNTVAEVPGAIPSLQRMHNLVMVPRQLALQRTIQGTGTGTYTYATIAPPDPTAPADALNSLIPPGAQSPRVNARARGLTLQNVSCSPITRDVVLLGPNNESIQIGTNESGKTFDALLTQRYDLLTGSALNPQTTSRVQVVALTGLSVAPGEKLLLWADKALGQIGVSNSGLAKTFKATVSIVDATTGKPTASRTVAGSVAANADFALAVSDWNQLSSAPTTRQGALQALLPANFQMPTVK
jgi:hypothetical protein